MRDSGRTVLLVTHDMRSVERFCDRAMLLDSGRIESLGDPSQISRRYLQLNFDELIGEEPENGGAATIPRRGPPEAYLTRAWLETADGTPTTNIEEGEEYSLHAILEVGREIPRPYIGFVISNSNGIDILGFGQALEDLESVPERLRAGQRIHFAARLENRLANGRYEVACWIHRDASFAEAISVVPGALDFVVYGGDIRCMVGVDCEVDIRIDDGAPG
jgi:ABC-type glutathione transport system ATPase component